MVASTGRVSIVVGTAVGVLLLLGVLASAGFHEVWRNLRAVDPGHLALYLGLMAGVYVLRALRFRPLIGAGARLPTLCGIVSIHTLMVNLLPFSAGELSYPLLLRRHRLRPDLITGVPSLVVARLQDLVVTGGLLVVALAWLGGGGLPLRLPAAGRAHLGLALLALLGGAALAALAARLDVRRRLGPRLEAVWAGIRAVGPRVWLATLGIAVLARLVAIVALSHLFLAVGIALPLGTVLVVNTLYTLLPLIPINAVAGLGVTQAYLVASFVAAGIEHGAAAAASVQIHGLQLLTSALLAGLGGLQLHHAAPAEHAGATTVRVPGPAASRAGE